MPETQESISTWAAEVFGEAGSHLRVAIRANEEMAELLTALRPDPATPASSILAETIDMNNKLANLLRTLSIESCAASNSAGDPWKEAAETPGRISKGSTGSS